MAKVALINPGKDQRFAVQEPLNLGFIASYLEKNGVEVRIIDELAGQNVKKELDQYRPEIVGLTATTVLVSRAYRIADMCRKKGILTVMGGVHASILPEEALRHVDIVVKGEGEQAMLDIIRDGINSGIVSRPYIKNIDEMPPPARHLMKMNFYLYTKDRLPETYLYFVPPHTKTASILTSRGCPYSCMFCHNTWRGIPYRFNSPERIISEIKALIKTYSIQALFFIEDNFFVNKTRVKKICELMKKEDLCVIWGANARVDNIDLEMLQMAKEAGCRQVTFGFESGSQRVLNILNKRTTVEQNKRAIELCNQVGIIPQGTVMIGNPTETIEDVRATQKFIRETNIKSVGVCITTPYPGTKLWQWCEEHKLIPRSFEWSDLDYHELAIPACDTMSPKQIKRLKIETSNIVAKKTPLNFSEVVSKIIKNPKETIKTIKNPSIIWATIKRLKR
ncbi:MAG: B12-binding domain-containing radical SAM protein [Desulfobacteraceae bacterium]|nr:B12-binding domain-containing radical SAM protein [Desulfobacteraceae bacterium]MCG2830524.1 B12-binding domain-containing radical SAM protein [Desulfobacteraceae bacterium]